MDNCIYDTIIFTEGTIQLDITDVNLLLSSGSVNIGSLPYTEDNYSLQQNNVLCSSPAVCTVLDLTGPETACNRNGLYEYRVQRNDGCNAPVSWLYNPAVEAELIDRNDSMATARFLVSGPIMLKVKLFSGCRWYEDSVLITATLAPVQPDLGPDTSICENNSLLLNAGSGFVTYLWQDGSSDSLFTVRSPGKYFVTAFDACDNLYADTIEVSAAPPVPFDIGDPVSKCNNDSVVLTAPAGFLHYSRSPSYNINTTAGGNVFSTLPISMPAGMEPRQENRRTVMSMYGPVFASLRMSQ